jgi:hypothetical protein
VQNGTFETGDFSSWILSGDTSATLVDDGSSSGTAPYSGNYEAALGTSGSAGFLTQTLPSVAGNIYLLSLWFNSPSGASPNEFLVAWNGVNIFDQTNIGVVGWTNMQFLVTANGSNSVLQLSFTTPEAGSSQQTGSPQGVRFNPQSYFIVDDIEVLPPPVPFFQSIVQSNGSVMFNWNAIAGGVYQIQYKDDLLATNWINLGSSINASNLMISASDSVTNLLRFYRLALMPQSN